MKRCCLIILSLFNFYIAAVDTAVFAANVVVQTKKVSLVLDVEKGRQPKYVD